MFSLLQARSIFNPLPLAKDHKSEHISQIQAAAKAAYDVFLNSSKEEHKEASQSLIRQLGSRKIQGLWWDQELEKQTSNFWESHIRASKFYSFHTTLYDSDIIGI